MRRKFWENLSLGGKGFAVVAIPLASLLLAVGLSYLVAVQPAADELYVTRYLQQVHSSTQQIQNVMQGAEAGVRGYLLTGVRAALRRFRTAERSLPAQFEDLQQLEKRAGEKDLGFNEPGAEGARDLMISLPGLQDLDSEIADIRGLAIERLRTLGGLVEEAGPSFIPTDPVTGLASIPDLYERLFGRADLIANLNDVLKPAQVQLFELPETASNAAADRRAEQLKIIVLVAALGLIGGLLALILFTRIISRRIAAVERGARRMAVGESIGELPTGKDAIGRLATEIGRTDDLLSERASSLLLARDEADRANEAKSAFLSRMSHELRTPLNAILGFGQLLQIDGVDPRQREDVDQIVKAGRHLLGLINEVLDIASVEAGRLTLSLEPVAVEEAFGEVTGLMRPLAQERNLQFTTPEKLGNLSVRADRQRLTQVLLNLVSNAIKYNIEGGKVALEVVRSEQGTLLVSVTDTGLGIPSDQIDQLFVPFDRLDADWKGVTGTGLGLALCKALVDAMNGSIFVTSEVGVGSKFVVELPEAQEQFVNHVAGGRSSPEGSVPRSITRSLLYIEDNLSNLRLVENMLRLRPGYHLTGTAQGSLGLELAESMNPDVILLDLDLPDIEGTEVLRRLKASSATRLVPIIIVTADASLSKKGRLTAEGAAAYVTKPFDVNVLLETLDMILESN